MRDYDRKTGCVHLFFPLFSESQWREKKDAESTLCAETDDVSQKHMEMLSQICRTHLRYPTTHQHSLVNTAEADASEQPL